LEAALAERVAIQLWRLGRVIRYETGVLEANLELVREGVLPNADGLVSPWGATTRLDDAAASRDHAEALGILLAEFPRYPDADQMPREAAVALIWAAYEAAFENRSVEVSIPGIPDDDDEFDEFDDWTVGLLRSAFRVYSAKANLTPEQLHSKMVSNASSAHSGASRLIERKERERERARRHNILPSKDVLEKIARYEASLERSLLRSLHELQRIQAYRTGGPAQIPTALDIDVSTRGA
jgi:hypothetical protein